MHLTASGGSMNFSIKLFCYFRW